MLGAFVFSGVDGAKYESKTPLLTTTTAEVEDKEEEATLRNRENAVYRVSVHKRTAGLSTDLQLDRRCRQR